MISKLANFLIVASVLTSEVTAVPFQGSKITARVRQADNRAKLSTDLLKRLLQAGGIPITVLNQAKAIGVFPVAKVKSMWGGKTKGQGVISRRADVGWTAPAFFEISKKSGSGIGSSESTIVLVFNGDNAVNGLSQGKINFAKNRSATPPTLNRPGGNLPKPTLDDGILCYEFVAGISIDPIIDDASVKPNNTDNKAVYGGLDAKDVLFLKKKSALARLEAADGAFAFTRTLNELSPNIIEDFPAQVYFESDRVRVVEFRLEPGGKVPMHRHPTHLVYPLADSNVKVSSADGKTVEWDLKAGRVIRNESGTYAWENAGATKNHVFIIELKSPEVEGNDLPNEADFSEAARNERWAYATSFQVAVNTVLNKRFSYYLPYVRDQRSRHLTPYVSLKDLPKNLRGEIALLLLYPYDTKPNEFWFRIQFAARERRSKEDNWRSLVSEEVKDAIKRFIDDTVKELLDAGRKE